MTVKQCNYEYDIEYNFWSCACNFCVDGWSSLSVKPLTSYYISECGFTYMIYENSILIKLLYLVWESLGNNIVCLIVFIKGNKLLWYYVQQLDCVLTWKLFSSQSILYYWKAISLNLVKSYLVYVYVTIYCSQDRNL